MRAESRSSDCFGARVATTSTSIAQITPVLGVRSRRVGQKKIPVKLQWRENVLSWINDNRYDLPKGVSRPAAHAVVGMIMQAATSQGKKALVSARWVERETGVNHSAVSDLLLFLTRSGWLDYIGDGPRAVPIYDLNRTRKIPPQSESEHETTTADSTAEDYSTTTGLLHSTRREEGAIS